MRKTVILSIEGRQNYVGQDPEIIELVTEGTLEQTERGWTIAYEESDLTGMQGVTTTFQIEKGKLVLTRSGKLNSQMVFQEGIRHESLYQMEFGALMLCVCARKIRTELTAEGGTVDLSYAIEIEQTETGVIDYHLDIRPKQ